MEKCDICGYQKDCPNVVETDSLWCETHRTIPKDFDNEYIEKQQLIKFLENKIKELKEEYGNYVYDYYSVEKATYDTYQEVLDFVRGYEDELYR